MKEHDMSQSEQGTPFERFEELARRLFAVPKRNQIRGGVENNREVQTVCQLYRPTIKILPQNNSQFASPL
jgi:hypothetical protein